MEYLEKYNEWCRNEIFDEETKAELKSIEGNDEEIKDRFYKDLEFGTAGLRGIVGIGTNRMNKYTVGKATQGLANFIIEKNGQNAGVAIAYDSRHMSKEFCELTALILNANGIKTYIFDSLRPTPVLSFTVKHLKCTAGIVITASHNPPKYNGYKVYWKDGSQIFGDIDKGITEKVKEIDDFGKIKVLNKQDAINKGLFNVLGKEIDDAYVNAVKGASINPEIIKEHGKELKIVYTPLHGTGYNFACRVLTELGFSDFNVVESQKEPNGDFPTVSYPNPEDPKAFDLALKYAKEIGADVVVANDPDADRIGIHVKDDKTGEYILFNGNMIGLTIAEYIISQNKKKGTLPENAALIKTIVSSKMTDAICKYYGIDMYEVLTGFKNIAAKIREFEANDNKNKCIMGYEESYGCLIGDHARDKDGIIAFMFLCEAAIVYKQEGLTLWDKMQEMYSRYNCYREDQIAITLEGADGAEKIQNMMKNMRENPLKTIGKYNVIKLTDYSTSISKNLSTGDEQTVDLPKSNVLRYELENDNWFCVRPSGTEPKIKFYMGVKSKDLETAEIELKTLKSEVKKLTEI